jgi:hypothetical protein
LVLEMTLADQHAVATEPHRSAADRHKIVSKKAASRKFILNFDRARSTPSVARFSPAMIVLTFSRLITTQTKIRLSKRSKSITDAAARLHRGVTR